MNSKNFNILLSKVDKKIFKNDIHKLVRRKWNCNLLIKWMKGPLQEFLKQVLSKDYSNSKNYFNFDEINKLISLHKENIIIDLLWSLAMMQIFLRNFKL